MRGVAEGLVHLQEALVVFWVSLQEARRGGKGVRGLMLEAWALLWNSTIVRIYKRCRARVSRLNQRPTRFEFLGGAKDLGIGNVSILMHMKAFPKYHRRDF